MQELAWTPTIAQPQLGTTQTLSGFLCNAFEVTECTQRIGKGNVIAFEDHILLARPTGLPQGIGASGQHHLSTV